MLEIEWRDPAGELRARWKDKTIKADKKGTRLYAWIAVGRRQGQGRPLEAPFSRSAASRSAVAASASSRELPVRVTVRLFAALRERAGTGKRELELPEGATAGDVFAALELGAEPPASPTP